MITIPAWQHIYSNVEKEQSPRQRGGFQTLFYSHAGLTPAEVEEMESRLLYFPAKNDDSPVKRLFFTTSGGKSVVSQIVPLAAPDQYGRGGRYLAHSLIFAPAALAQAGGDPFRVWAQAAFAATIEAALALGNFATGDIPPVSLTLPPADPTLDAAQGWPAAELKKLALLALRAPQLAAERQAITVSGAAAHIEAALAAALVAVPDPQRQHCAFDTYFYRCNLVAAYFWAIGLPEPPAGVKFMQIDAAARQFYGNAPLQPETSYERWACYLIDQQRLAALAQHKNPAWALGEWLDGRAYEPDALNAAPTELIEELFTVCADAVRNALARQLKNQLPAALVERAVTRILAESAGARLYEYLRQGFERRELPDILCQSYAAQSFEKPSGAEQAGLQELLQAVEHGLLRLLLAYWRNPKKELPEQLKQADNDLYRQFAALAQQHRLVEPLALLVPGKIGPFLQAQAAGPPVNLVDIAKKLVGNKEPGSLEQLAGLVSPLPRGDLEKLYKLARKHNRVAPGFLAAVKRALAALPPESGLKARLKSLLLRLPGR